VTGEKLNATKRDVESLVEQSKASHKSSQKILEEAEAARSRADEAERDISEGDEPPRPVFSCLLYLRRKFLFLDMNAGLFFQQNFPSNAQSSVSSAQGLGLRA
jgi:hypothetical protein